MSRKQNRSFSETNQKAADGMLWKVIVTFNLLIALASGGFALAALINPAFLLPSGSEVTPAVDFYVRYYAVRSLLLLSCIVILVLLGSTSWLGGFLILAGLIQAGDVLIGISYGNWQQILLPAIAAGIHLASARWILRYRLQAWYD